MEGRDEREKRVLILDPEPFIRDTLKLKLAGRGLKAVAAENEEEIRRELLGGSPPAAIILDILHSRLNSYRFLQWLRNQPALEKIPVVILTFKEKDPETSFIYNVWSQAYLTKPFIPQDVVNRVAELVAQAEAAAKPPEERF